MSFIGVPPVETVYYLDLHFINTYGEHAADVSWTQNGKQIKHTVHAKMELFKSSAWVSSSQPAAIIIIARRHGTDEVVKMNGQETFPVVPSTVKEQTEITLGGMPAQVLF